MRFACAIYLLLSILPGFTFAVSDVTADNVDQLIKSGRHKEAVPLGKQLLLQAENEYGPDSLQAATAAQMISLAMSFGKIGEKEERQDLAERAVEIRRRLLDERDPLLALAIYTLGQVHYQTNDYPTAAIRFGEALVLADKYYGSNATEVYDFVREYGAALFMSARYEDALAAFERQVTIITDHAGADHPAIIDAYNNLARVYSRLDRYHDAEIILQRLVDTLDRRIPPDSIRLFRALRTMSVNLTFQGRFDEGLAAGERALRIGRDSSTGPPDDLALILNNLAVTLIRIDDHEKALHYLKEADSILNRETANPATLLRIRINQARCHRGLGQNDEAMSLLRQSQADAASGGAAVEPVLGGFHYYAGRIERSAGDFTAAASSYRKALQVLASQGQQDSFDSAEVLRDLALLDLDSGRTAEARAGLEASAEIMENLTGRSHPDFIQILDGLARADLLSGSRSKAIDTGLEAESLRAVQIAETVSGLPERQALALAGQQRTGLDAAIGAVLGGGGDRNARRAVVEAVFQARAVVFDEMVARSELAHSATEPDLATLVQRLRRRKTTLANLFLQGPGDRPEWYRSIIQKARDEIEILETGLADKSSTYRAKVTSRGVEFDEVVGAIPPFGVCISYIRFGGAGESRYAAIVLFPLKDHEPRFIDLGPVDIIDAAVGSWRKTMLADSVLVLDPAAAEAACHKAGNRLRALIWDPVAAYAADAAIRLIVPAGSIHLVSFAALPTKNGGYLVEQEPVLQYLTTERDLIRKRLPETAGEEILIVGNPRYDKKGLSPAGQRISTLRGVDSVCSGFRETRFTALPETGREARQVQRFWLSGKQAGKALLLENQAATERAFRNQSGSKSVLHLATHGYFLGEECGGKGTVRGIGGLASKAKPEPVPGPTPNPLLLSGLALAGANSRLSAGDADNDGILTAEEIASLDLQNVRLAVLSACRAGAGTIQAGEGIFGLRRAFLTAGVDTVVTNLWDVEDKAGREWVRAFYSGHLLRNLPVARAVREASLKLLSNRRERGQPTHPFFWAGWLATGAAG